MEIEKKRRSIKDRHNKEKEKKVYIRTKGTRDKNEGDNADVAENGKK